MGGTFSWRWGVGSTASIKNYGNFTYDFVTEPIKITQFLGMNFQTKSIKNY